MKQFLIIKLVLIFLFFSAGIQAQLVLNSSFEGTPGASRIPPNWSTCHQWSSPDTQPGSINVFKEASDGATYVSLLTRGDLGGNAKTTEDIQATLIDPLIISECYDLSFDLSATDSAGFYSPQTGWIDYRKPVHIEVWAGDATCISKELIWKSPLIDHTNWKNYSVKFQANFGITNLLLVAVYNDLPEYFGCILLDNLNLNSNYSSTIMLDTLVYENSEVQVRASEGASYLWEDADNITCPTCQSVVIDAIESVIYEVEIIDSIGCAFSEEFRIDTKPVEEYLISNIITPNGDGKNDVFLIDYLPSDCFIQIFGRWGTKVFEASGSDISWNARGVESGVYFYQIQLGNQKLYRSGYITVVK